MNEKQRNPEPYENLIKGYEDSKYLPNTQVFGYFDDRDHLEEWAGIFGYNFDKFLEMVNASDIKPYISIDELMSMTPIEAQQHIRCKWIDSIEKMVKSRIKD